MKKLPVVALAVLALAACEQADEVTAPSPERPSFHTVPPGAPDGGYSLYFTGSGPASTLALKVAQEWDIGTTTECPSNDGTHDDHTHDPMLVDALSDMEPARGDGFFAFRNRSGSVTITQACWFGEWNGAGGYPESAWVRGTATVGHRTIPFAAKLSSNGWPERTHIFHLDTAEFYLDEGRDGLARGDELFTVDGELHHEDGSSLVVS